MNRDTKFFIWVENNHPHGRSTIYIYSDDYYYTLVDGIVTQNKLPQECAISIENTHFLKGPIWFVDLMAEGISKWLESKGGINKDQMNKGKIERLENETDWLRKLIEGQLK